MRIRANEGFRGGWIVVIKRNRENKFRKVKF